MVSPFLPSRKFSSSISRGAWYSWVRERNYYKVSLILYIFIIEEEKTTLDCGVKCTSCDCMAYPPKLGLSGTRTLVTGKLCKECFQKQKKECCVCLDDVLEIQVVACGLSICKKFYDRIIQVKPAVLCVDNVIDWSKKRKKKTPMTRLSLFLIG